MSVEPTTGVPPSAGRRSWRGRARAALAAYAVDHRAVVEHVGVGRVVPLDARIVAAGGGGTRPRGRRAPASLERRRGVLQRRRAHVPAGHGACSGTMLGLSPAVGEDPVDPLVGRMCWRRAADVDVAEDGGVEGVAALAREGGGVGGLRRGRSTMQLLDGDGVHPRQVGAGGVDHQRGVDARRRRPRSAMSTLPPPPSSAGVPRTTTRPPSSSATRGGGQAGAEAGGGDDVVPAGVADLGQGVVLAAARRRRGRSVPARAHEGGVERRRRRARRRARRPRRAPVSTSWAWCSSKQSSGWAWMCVRRRRAGRRPGRSTSAANRSLTAAKSMLRTLGAGAPGRSPRPLRRAMGAWRTWARPKNGSRTNRLPDGGRVPRLAQWRSRSSRSRHPSPGRWRPCSRCATRSTPTSTPATRRCPSPELVGDCFARPPSNPARVWLARLDGRPGRSGRCGSVRGRGEPRLRRARA